MKARSASLALAALLAAPSIVRADPNLPSSWTQWRGPLANGSAPQATPPLKWSETENLRWKIKLPGFGTSTPIILGQKIFILTAIPAEPAPGTAQPAAAPAPPPQANPAPGRPPGQAGGRGGGSGSEKPSQVQRFMVLCLDRATGKTLWEKVAREELPHEGHHRDHGFASASPITDGQLLFAFFGSRGLYCYDLDGNLKWHTDLGDMRTRNGFGEGSSPALHGDTLVVNWDHEGDDFIVAFNKHTGKELWRQTRDEPTGWSTPLIITHAGKPQVIVNATQKVRSYDLASGKILWELGGQTVNAIPSPVADADTVYLTSGFRATALHAVTLGRSGDLTGSDAVRWNRSANTPSITPYVPSPLLIDNLLYLVAENRGVLSCFDAKTGKAHYEGERLPGIFGIYASPVAAGDRVYVLGREGTCLVLKKGPTLEILATNKLDDRTDASIALVDKELYIRGHQNLYCISE